MQSGKKAVESVKETASNVAATARSGMEKTKATLQEKGEKMSAHTDTDTDKLMSEQRKEERIAAAELNKQEAHAQNAANTATAGHHSYSTTGEQGYTAGPNQMSALPGHGTGQPTGRVVEGMVQSHPIGTATGTTRQTTAHNTRAGSGANTTGYGTGGGYTSSAGVARLNGPGSADCSMLGL